MNVIGLDLAIRGVGLVAIPADPKRCFKTYAFGAPNFLKEPGDVYKNVLESVMSCIGAEDIVFIEDYAFGKITTITKLAEINGLVRFSIWRRTGTWPMMVAPMSLKKWLTGDGKAEKDKILLNVFKRFGHEFGTSHEADAFGLADFGLHLITNKPRRKLHVWEEEALARWKDKHSNQLQALATCAVHLDKRK